MLPTEIQEEINVRLDEGKTLRSISNWLATKGHANISVENLSHWKYHGFQDWVEQQDRLEHMAALRQWASESGGDPADMALAAASFITTKLYALLRAVDTPSVQKQLRKDPKLYLQYIDRILRASRVTIKAQELRKTLPARRELSPDDDDVITIERLEEFERLVNLL